MFVRTSEDRAGEIAGSPERLALLFAARDGDVRRFDSGEIPELVVGGIDAAAATELLTELGGVPVLDDVRDRLMSQTGGSWPWSSCPGR